MARAAITHLHMDQAAEAAAATDQVVACTVVLPVVLPAAVVLDPCVVCTLKFTITCKLRPHFEHRTLALPGDRLGVLQADPLGVHPVVFTDE